MQRAATTQSRMSSPVEIRFLGSNMRVKIVMAPAITYYNFVKITSGIVGIAISCSYKDLMVVDCIRHDDGGLTSFAAYKIVFYDYVIMPRLQSRTDTDEIVCSLTVGTSGWSSMLVERILSPSFFSRRHNLWEELSKMLSVFIMPSDFNSKLHRICDCLGNEQNSNILIVAAVHPGDI